MTPLRLFVLAGEPSGDTIGARFIQALRNQTDRPLELFGVGGPRMTEQGLDSLFPMDELSLIGFAEVVPHLPRLWRRMRQTTAAIRERRPELVLTIDSPGFALRLQQRIRPMPPIRVHYVAPQAWAWREQRAARLADDVDHLLALLPFEPPFFARHGVTCSFVGHPIVEEAIELGHGPRFRRRHDLPADAPVLCLLPGSRRGEIAHHLPILEDVAASLWRRMPRLRVVLPTLPGIAPTVRSMVAGWKLPVLVLEDRDERFDAYAASWLAIAASGTVSLEVALAGLPVVTIYRTGPLTGWLARRLIRVPYVNMVNLILGRPAVPELLQEACRPDRITAAALRLLEDESARIAQQEDLATAVSRLGTGHGQLPSEAAAARVLAILDEHQTPRRTS